MILSISCNLKGQSHDIFDSTQTLKYANYLFSAHDFIPAANEYERLLFLKKNNPDSLKWLVIQSYRLSQNDEKALLKLIEFFPDTQIPTRDISLEYLKILIHQKKTNLIKAEISRISQLSEEDKLVFGFSNEFLAENFKQSRLLLNENPIITNPVIQKLKHLSDEQNSLKLKNPYSAGILSAIFPGLGQAYAGSWKDGGFALLMTGSSAYQAYRGFNKHGINSVYGWIFSGLATGFYLGNIYGASKSANKYNYLKNIKIIVQVETIFYNYN